jgi:hypothetical protein
MSTAEKWSHRAQVIGIPIAVAGVIGTLWGAKISLDATKKSLDATKESNTTYQGTALCEAYREQVIDLHLLGYNADAIRRAFLGEHDDVTRPASEVNNVYDRFYVPECGSVEAITKGLSRPAPLDQLSQR